MNPDQEFALLDRIVDRRETVDDWRSLEARAAAEPELWERVARVLQDDCRLRRALHERLGDADRVVLPLPVSPPRAAAARSWLLGAAAVFVIALGWFFTRSGTVPPAASFAAAGPTQLFERYLSLGRERGQVVDELPNLTLEVRNAPGNDGLEVIYLRRVVERAIVQEAWQVGTDEHGQPRPAKVDVASYRPSSSF